MILKKLCPKLLSRIILSFELIYLTFNKEVFVLRPNHNGRLFADSIWTYRFLYEHYCFTSVMMYSYTVYT